MCLSERIRQAVVSCGFENCGIISIDAMEGFAQRLRERKKRVPSSKPFYLVLDELAQTKARFPWAKSIVVCTYYYGQFRYPKQLQGYYAKDYFLKPEELADALAPEKILSQPDEYLQKHVIAKTDNHLKPSDAAVIRRNAKRALKYREK